MFTYRAGATLASPNLAGGVEIGSIRISGVSDGTHDGTYELENLAGVFDGSPDLRSAVSGLSSDDGGFAGLPFYNPRDITLEGMLTVPTLADIDGALDLLKSTFNVVGIPGQPVALQQLTMNRLGWANKRFLMVRVAGPLSMVEPDGLAKQTPDRLFSVPLIAPDPFMYNADTLQAVTVTSGGTTLTNNGNANAPFVVRFNGALTNPQLLGPGLTGRILSYNGTITSGHWVEVSTNSAGDGTALYAVDDTGADVSGNLGDFTARVIPPGGSSWSITGGAGTVTVSFRDAWL